MDKQRWDKHGRAYTVLLRLSPMCLMLPRFLSIIGTYPIENRTRPPSVPACPKEWVFFCSGTSWLFSLLTSSFNGIIRCLDSVESAIESPGVLTACLWKGKNESKPTTWRIELPGLKIAVMPIPKRSWIVKLGFLCNCRIEQKQKTTLIRFAVDATRICGGAGDSNAGWISAVRRPSIVWRIFEVVLPRYVWYIT